MDDVTRGTRAAVSHYERTGEIRGLKTRPFCSALLGAKDAIVLDTWMARAMRCDANRLGVVKVWGHCARQLERASRMLGWHNAETQAAIWAAAVRAERTSVPSLDLMPLIDGIPI
jgi:hypothetical protein